ncbi:hypothetical protein IAT38_003284 [Cryptococcus sp. DSM 104549]
MGMDFGDNDDRRMDEQEGEDDEGDVPVESFLREVVALGSAPLPPPPRQRRRRHTYYKFMTNQWDNWGKVRGKLFDSYSGYREKSDTFRAPLSGEGAIDLQAEQCKCEEDQKESREMTLVTIGRQIETPVTFCKCCSDPERLARMGYIATTPSRPRTAISFHLILFFHKLWRHSPMSVDGFANGLWASHKEMRPKGTSGPEDVSRPGPFVRQALKVYRDLKSQERVMLETCLCMSELDKMACKCPMCLRLRKHHTFVFFLPKRYLDWAEQLRKATDHVKVGNDGTACSDNWRAKDGGAGPEAYKGKSDTGLVAMVCRHGVALKGVNLYKSGEKLSYALSLIAYFLRDVAKDARAAILYDIACNLHGHFRKRDILRPEREGGRLKLALAVWHAYAHNWLCQMRYNPRYLEGGFGLSVTDGESVERHWSSTRSLISLNRSASGALRRDNYDDLVQHLNSVTRSDLPTAARNRMARTLEEQWIKQQSAQGKEGEVSETTYRAKRYSDLGEMIMLWDETQSALEKLPEACRTDNVHAMARATRTFARSTEKWNSLSPDVRAEVMNKTRTEGKAVILLCRVHATHSALRRLVDEYRMLVRPIRDTRTGKKSSLGMPVIKPPLAVSWGAVCAREESDIFWRDVIFQTQHEDAWSIDGDCREGIFALLDQRRCEEEVLLLLTSELARLIRWAGDRYNLLTRQIAVRESTVRDVAELDDGLRLELGEQDLYQSLPGDATLHISRSALFLLREQLCEHLELERKWIGGGGCAIWLKPTKYSPRAAHITLR